MNPSEGYKLTKFEVDNANVTVKSHKRCSSITSDSLHSLLDSLEIACDTSEDEVIDSVSTSDSDGADEQVADIQGNWAELPSLAVEKIYSFLSRPDQSRMSLVCSRWEEVFSSPSLWKLMKFYLNERSSSPEIYPEVKFARKYDSIVRHIEIICPRVTPNRIDVIWRQLNMFLQAMESSQLLSIQIIHMRAFGDTLDLLVDLVETLTSFFNSQENLKTVVFLYCHFSNEKGMDLLKSVFHCESNMIQNLTITGFVNKDPWRSFSQQYLSNLYEVSCKFANIKSIHVDYSKILEDIVYRLFEKFNSGEYQPDKNKSSYSIPYYFGTDIKHFSFNRTLPEIWKCLIRAFPILFFSPID